jgi:hypothetical protein
MAATATVTAFSRPSRCNGAVRRGRPTNESVAELELTARGHEAHLFSAAVRTVVSRLESILLQPSAEVPPDAFALTMQPASSGLGEAAFVLPPATQPGATDHAVPATHAALPLAVTQASPAH